MTGFYDRYWEMSEGGPYDDEKSSNKIFKCTDCGAETAHKAGWNGEPETNHCQAHCSSRASDWKPGRVSRRFRRNIEQVEMSDTPLIVTGRDTDPVKAGIKAFKAGHDEIFPDAPGAGI